MSLLNMNATESITRTPCNSFTSNTNGFIDMPNGDTHTNEIDMMSQVELDRQDIYWSWQDTTFDLYDRYNSVVDVVTRLHKEMYEVEKFINEVKVPFEWEYTRLTFKNNYEDLLAEFEVYDTKIAAFPREVEVCRMMAFQSADKEVSEGYITHLENIIGSYANKLVDIEEDFTHAKRAGMRALEASQKISTFCGEPLI